MQTILKIICLFISLFVIVNGCYAYIMPPYGDEPLALGLIATGVFIALLTLAVAQQDDRSRS